MIQEAGSGVYGQSKPVAYGCVLLRNDGYAICLNLEQRLQDLARCELQGLACR